MELTKLRKEKNINKSVVIKISPDINDSQISGLIELITKYNIQGIIISNTTDKNRGKTRR